MRAHQPGHAGSAHSSSRRGAADAGKHTLTGSLSAPAREPLQDVDFENLFEFVHNYAVDRDNGKQVAFVDLGEPTVNALLIQLMTVVNLSLSPQPVLLANALQLWGSLRPAIEAMAPRAARLHVAPDHWARAKLAIDVIESYLVDSHVQAQVESRVADADAGHPDDAIGEQAVKEAPKAAGATLELLKKIDAYSEAHLGSLPEDKLLGVKSSAKMVSWVFESVTGGMEMKELIEKFNKRGFWGKVATAYQVGQIIAETLHGGLEVSIEATKYLGYKVLGKEAAEALEHLPALQALEGGAKVLGAIASAFGIASSAMKLIDGIVRGDAKQIENASFGLAEGIAAATLGGAGLAIGAYFEAWKALLDAAMHLQAVLQEIKQEHKVDTLMAVVGHAIETMQEGKQMVAAEEALEAQEGSKLEKGLNQRVIASLAARAQAQAKRTSQSMLYLGGQLQTIVKYPELDAAFGQDAWGAIRQLNLEELQPGQTQVDNRERQLDAMTSTCKMMMTGIDRIVRRVQHEDELGRDKDPEREKREKENEEADE